jgi:hypothetical protein
VAEGLLTWLERDTLGGAERASFIAGARRLLGHQELERKALEALVAGEEDPLARLPAEGRIAVLLADTGAAMRVDSALAESHDQPLRNPWTRGSEILARAHIAAGFGRREQAVALLRAARARSLLPLGSSNAFHTDLLLAPLRGYPPFDALLEPDD